jgi:hypothetical protein
MRVVMHWAREGRMSKESFDFAVPMYGLSWLLLLAALLLLVGGPLGWVFGYLAGWTAVKAVVLAVFVIVVASICFAITNAMPNRWLESFGRKKDRIP